MEPRIAPNGWTAEFLDSFRRGNRQALTEVYASHVDDTARILRRGFGFQSRGQRYRFSGYASAFELHDALQETFRLAFEEKARCSYDGIRPYAPYLHTIARNVVLSQFRKAHKHFVLLGDESDERIRPRSDAREDAWSESEAERELGQSQLRTLMAEFMSGLSDEDRKLIRYRFHDGLSQRDAADAMEWGRQKVRTWEIKLRQSLIAFFKARGEHAWVDEAVRDGALLVALFVAALRDGGVA